MALPYLVENAPREFLATGAGESLLVFEAHFKNAITGMTRVDQKIKLLDEAVKGIVALPDSDNRLQVLLDFLERQRQILAGDPSGAK